MPSSRSFDLFPPVQRQTTTRFSPRPTSQLSNTTPHERPQAGTIPYIQFSPNSLWTHYDDSPSPTSDDQEFEFTEFGGDFVPALELRSSSPLFQGLDDEIRPPNRLVEPNPPTLPPLRNMWDDPLEDLIEYSSNTPRAGSSNARTELVASSIQSGAHTQPALDRTTTRNLPPMRDTEARSTTSSGGDHYNHSLPSPFLPNLGSWMEGEHNALLHIPTEWSPSPTRENASTSLARTTSRDTAGPSRSDSLREAIDWSWSPSRGNISANGVHPRLLSRDSSASVGRAGPDEARVAFRAMLSSDHRDVSAQASSSAVSMDQSQEGDSVPRRLRFSGTQLGTPLEAQMEPWLTGEACVAGSSAYFFFLTRAWMLDRTRDSPSPQPEDQGEGLTPEERTSNQLDAIAAASRRSLLLRHLSRKSFGCSTSPLIYV
jgi:hypothetical protein